MDFFARVAECRDEDGDAFFLRDAGAWKCPEDRCEDGRFFFIRSGAEQRFAASVEFAESAGAAFADAGIRPAEAGNKRLHGSRADERERLDHVGAERAVVVPEVLNERGNGVLRIRADEAECLRAAASQAGVVALEPGE